MKHSKRLFSGLFYVPKYEKVSEKAFLRIMLSSIFGILICGICLAGLTWAWFTGSVSSTANTITAADFSVGVEFKQNELVIEPAIENESYKLNSGTYKVTITASGSATTGYCTVELKLSDNNEKIYHTIQLYPAGGEGKQQSVEFTVSVSDGSHLAITSQWGTCAVKATAENPRIGNQEDTENHIINSIGASTKPQATVAAVSPEAEQQATESVTTYAIIDTEQNSIPEASTAQPTAAENAESEPSASETPKQTEESSSDLSTQPTSQEGVSEKGTASEAQIVPTTDTTGAATDEP